MNQTVVPIKCWNVQSSVGSWISIDFGRKIKRLKPVKNTALSEEQRLFTGEWSVFTSGSFWSLLVNNWVHVDATFPNKHIEQKLGILIGDHVISRTVTDEHVLILKFDSGAIFTVFPNSDNDEYCLFSGNSSLEDYSQFLFQSK